MPRGAVSSRSTRKISTALQTPAARDLATAVSGAMARGGRRRDQSDALGTPGNLNMAGFLTDEDYNAALDGYQAYKVWDEMRRGNAQVNATLLMCKLPIKAARWVIRPASQDDPQDQAIADFATAALLDDDAMATSWSDVLDNALLKLDFGSSAHEKVWMIDDAGALRYDQLAPRLPKTFYRWVENDQTGVLDHLQQFAPKGGRYGFWDIPVDRLVLHVLNREGNNWYGRSILRAAYPHFFWVKQLYRIGAVGADRELQGIPRAKLGPEYNETIVTLDKIETTLKGLRSYDRAYVIEPYGVEFNWMESAGAGERLRSLVEFIEHHNVMIARNILQQFAAQGSQKYGSKGASEVTRDAFYDALEGIARELAAEFRQQAIKPLCEANFDMTGRKTPTLEATDLGAVDSGAITEGLAKLSTAKLITPDDDLEDYVRELLGAPKMLESARGRDRASVVVPPPFGGAPAPGTATGSAAPSAGGTTAPGAEPGKGTDGQATTEPQAKIVNAAKGFEEGGIVFSREPTDRERRILALHAIPQELNAQKAHLARALAEIRLARLDKVAAVLAKKDARATTGAFTDLRRQELPALNTVDLKRAIRATQTAVAAYGAQQVREELQRQGVTLTQDLQTQHRTPAASKQSLTSTLVSSADTTARRLADEWDSLVLENAIRLRRSGLVGDAFAQALVDGLKERAETGVLRAAAGEVNEAFGLGRAREADTLKGHIETAEYSAVMDTATCQPCSDLDGQVFEIDSPDYDAAMPPNRDCLGGDGCRCVFLFLGPTSE